MTDMVVLLTPFHLAQLKQLIKIHWHGSANIMLTKMQWDGKVYIGELNQMDFCDTIKYVKMMQPNGVLLNRLYELGEMQKENFRELLNI